MVKTYFLCGAEIRKVHRLIDGGLWRSNGKYFLGSINARIGNSAVVFESMVEKSLTFVMFLN